MTTAEAELLHDLQGTWLEAAIERIWWLTSDNQGVVLDTETSGLLMYAANDPSRVIGFAGGALDHPDTDIYVPIRHDEGNHAHLLPRLVELLSRSNEWTCHNGPFDMRISKFEGIPFPRSLWDTQPAAHLTNENEPNYKLKDLGARYFGTTAAKEKTELDLALKAKKLDMGGLAHLHPELVGRYAVQDIKLTRQLRRMYEPLLAKWRLTKLHAEVCRYAIVLAKMTERGLRINREEIRRQQTYIQPRLAEIRARIVELAGFDINLNSPKQLKAWLKLSKTDAPTLIEVLEGEEREDVRLLLEYRAIFKADSTYFQPFMEQADENDRLHTNFNVHRTVTGRLSSSEPNLQNASRNAAKRKYSVRNCFIPTEGYFFAEFDYSSVEPRLAVHYTGDVEMIEAFNAGFDFHRTQARKMLRKENISSEERTSAKSLGLGLLYGTGAYKSAVKCGLRHERNEDGTWDYHHELVWTFVNDELVRVACSEVSHEYCTAAGKEYSRKYFDAWPKLKPTIQRVANQAESLAA